MKILHISPVGRQFPEAPPVYPCQRVGIGKTWVRLMNVASSAGNPVWQVGMAIPKHCGDAATSPSEVPKPAKSARSPTPAGNAD